jgi:hypothetical protein
MPSRIQLRRDTGANWTAANPVLAAGEPGLDITVNLVKYGDGVTAWNSLPYAEFNTEDIDSNLIPSTDVTYNLGNATHRWNSLYLSGDTIYLGDASLSAVDGTLEVNGNTIPVNDNVMTDRGADTTNWNNITTMGYYTVNRTSWSGVTGAPLDCQVYKGTLAVTYTTNGADTALTQIFYPGAVASATDVTIQFNRSQWNNSWTGWYKIVNDKQIVSGGLF